MCTTSEGSPALIEEAHKFGHSHLVTSRKPADIPAFNAKMIELFKGAGARVAPRDVRVIGPIT